MDITQLRHMGLATSNPLIKKTITIKYYPLKEGSTTEREEEQAEGSIDFWIRRFTASDRIATAQLANSDPDEATLLAVQRSIFSEDGKPVFPDTHAVRELDLEMFAPLLLAINEINGGGAKKSHPRTNGGTRSPSPSVAGRSGSGRKSSRSKSSTSGSSSPTNMAP